MSILSWIGTPSFAKSPHTSSKQLASQKLSSEQIASELLNLLIELYQLSSPKDSADRIKDLIMGEIRAEYQFGTQPLQVLNTHLPRNDRGQFFNHAYELWSALPDTQNKLKISGEHLQRLSRQLFKRSAQSVQYLNKVEQLALAQPEEKPQLPTGLLDGSYTLALENLTRAHRQRNLISSISSRGRKVLKETITLLKEAEHRLERASQLGERVSGEQYILIQLGLMICYLKLDARQEVKQAVTRLMTTPSVSESLLGLREMALPKVEAAKALAFDLQRDLKHTQEKTTSSLQWIEPFSLLTTELRNWAKIRRSSRHRLREIKGKTARLIQRSSQLHQWWSQEVGRLRKHLQEAEEVVALQQLIITIALTARRRQSEAGDSVHIEWVQLPSGSLWVADPQDISKAVQVRFKRPFFIAKSEVTVAQYQRCVEAGACEAPYWNDCMLWSGKHYQRGVAQPTFQESQRPVVCVTWSQARSFSQWVGGDLPSESEWMYAAQNAGRGSSFPWGEQTATCEFAIMNEGVGGCGEQRTWDVCSRPSGESEQGVCDLAGNVWEWVLDEGSIQDSVQFDSQGKPRCEEINCDTPLRAHIARGGGWGSGKKYLRTTTRFSFEGVNRHLFLGFRPIKRMR